jgi:hypothetical protein
LAAGPTALRRGLLSFALRALREVRGLRLAALCLLSRGTSPAGGMWRTCPTQIGLYTRLPGDGLPVDWVTPSRWLAGGVL